MVGGRSTRAPSPSRTGLVRHLSPSPPQAEALSSSSASVRLSSASLQLTGAGMLPLPGFGVQWTLGEPGGIPPVMDRREGLPIDHRQALFVQVSFIILAVFVTQLLFA